MNNNRKHPQAFIFAAGFGKRLHPLTKKYPKPLIQIGNTTLIEKIIMQLKDANITEILINVSYLRQQITSKLGDGEQYGVNISYQVEEPTPRETAGALIYAIETGKLDLERNILVVNSDIYTDFNFEKISNMSVEDAHLVLVKNPKHNLGGDFGLENGAIGNFKKKYTYSGIGIYNTSFIHNNYCSSKLGKVIKTYLEKNQLTGQIYHGDWHDVGTVERLEVVRKLALEYNN